MTADPSPDLSDLPECIDLSPTVSVDLYPGAKGVRWATLHVGNAVTEVGSVRTWDDLKSVLSTVALILRERYVHTKDMWMSDDRSLSWVLVGTWVLDASGHGVHTDLGNVDAAAVAFRQLRKAGQAQQEAQR